jgi:hypothetical protein
VIIVKLFWDFFPPKIIEWEKKYPNYRIELIQLEINTKRPDNNLIVITNSNN